MSGAPGGARVSVIRAEEMTYRYVSPRPCTDLRLITDVFAARDRAVNLIRPNDHTFRSGMGRLVCPECFEGTANARPRLPHRGLICVLTMCANYGQCIGTQVTRTARGFQAR